MINIVINVIMQMANHGNMSWGVGDVCERIPQLPVCPTYLVTEVILVMILVIIAIIILVILIINNLVIVIMIIVVIKTIIGDCAGSAVFGFRAVSFHTPPSSVRYL